MLFKDYGVLRILFKRMLNVKVRHCLCFLGIGCFIYIALTYTRSLSINAIYTGFTQDPHLYKFIINHPYVCSSDNITLLFMVHSGCANFERRLNIRTTWATVTQTSHFNIKVFFVLGRNEKLQRSISEENEKYKDILQQDFMDTYRNLTLKNQMAMKWPSIYCKSTKFIVKMDDDVMVNVYHLSQFLMSKLQMSLVTDFLYCHVFDKEYPHRWSFPFGKWKLTYEEYPDDGKFPDFCRGTAYILSPDVATKLWRSSYQVPPIFIDDVFMTGLVRKHVNIRAQHGVSPYRMGASLADAYKSKIAINDALFFIPESWIQLYNWKYVWSQIQQSAPLT